MSDPDTRIAVIVDPSLLVGLMANTVATIGIGIGTVVPAFGSPETSISSPTTSPIFRDATSKKR